jgi:hypothetical protein
VQGVVLTINIRHYQQKKHLTPKSDESPTFNLSFKWLTLLPVMVLPDARPGNQYRRCQDGDDRPRRLIRLVLPDEIQEQ